MLNGDTIVYVTRTGKKYHSENCCYLFSCIEIELSEAIKSYSSCSRCDPQKPSYERVPQENSLSNRSSKLIP
jgi:hypothetical protein